MAFKNIKKTQGRDFNFFQRATVTWSQFGAPDGYTTLDGYGPDMVITFPTYGVIFHHTSGDPVEYSFNGSTVHGELTAPGADGYGRTTLVFENRAMSLIWFRLKSGTTANISVEAWGTR